MPRVWLGELYRVLVYLFLATMHSVVVILRWHLQLCAAPTQSRCVMYDKVALTHAPAPQSRSFEEFEFSKPSLAQDAWTHAWTKLGQHCLGLVGLERRSSQQTPRY
jgi:hypothetical protein